MTEDTMAHIAEVSFGSALDYLHAAVSSERSDRAAFLILAHVQTAGSALLYAQLQNEDKSFKDRFDSASGLEKRLRYEVYRMAEVGATVSTSEPFPHDEFLLQVAQEYLQKGFKPVALTLGTQACWEGPFANVYTGN